MVCLRAADAAQVRYACWQATLTETSFDFTLAPFGSPRSIDVLSLPPDALEHLGAALADEPSALVRDGGVFRTGHDAALDELRAIDEGCDAFLARMEVAERERTGDTQPDNTWNSDKTRPPPDGVTTSSLWVVVQDERGGTDWQQYALQLQ